MHNISHADLVLLLQERPPTGAVAATAAEPRSFIARPQFNSFQPIAEVILGYLDRIAESGALPRVVNCLSKYRVQYPAGLSLDGAPDDATPPWAKFHLKGFKGTASRKAPSELPELASGITPRIAEVYLPLLAVVLPEWIRSIKRRAVGEKPGTPPPKKVLVLVSGAGQPRDERANPQDNSTEGTGRIIERFVHAVHPDIEVVHIPSAFGIFRYDDNVRFVKEQVLPVVEAKRAQVVAAHGDEWTSKLKVTVCLADGAPARISALNAAMRSYRPDYLHLWRTKTFWDTRTLSEEDVESHAFKKLEMRPAIHRSQLPSEMERALVDEMIRYKRQFEAVRDSQKHELDTFWLRKTGKVVLAVVVTKKAGGSGEPGATADELTFWRGMNIEVSMPTGTLCAERNAIGNALAADQSVTRKDMQAVAVLSISLDPLANGHEDSDEDEELRPEIRRTMSKTSQARSTHSAPAHRLSSPPRTADRIAVLFDRAVPSVGSVWAAPLTPVSTPPRRSSPRWRSTRSTRAAPAWSGSRRSQRCVRASGCARRPPPSLARAAPSSPAVAFSEPGPCPAPPPGEPRLPRAQLHVDELREGLHHTDWHLLRARGVVTYRPVRRLWSACVHRAWWRVDCGAMARVRRRVGASWPHATPDACNIFVLLGKRADRADGNLRPASSAFVGKNRYVCYCRCGCQRRTGFQGMGTKRWSEGL